METRDRFYMSAPSAQSEWKTMWSSFCGQRIWKLVRSVEEWQLNAETSVRARGNFANGRRDSMQDGCVPMEFLAANDCNTWGRWNRLEWLGRTTNSFYRLSICHVHESGKALLQRMQVHCEKVTNCRDRKVAQLVEWENLRTSGRKRECSGKPGDYVAK
jgi:hypothetical protein